MSKLGKLKKAQSLGYESWSEYLKAKHAKIRSTLTQEEYEAKKRLRNERLKQNNQAKYGVDCVSQLAEVKLKVKKTMNKRFGKDSNMLTEEFKEKRNKTWSTKYQGGHPSKDPKIKEKTKNTNLKNYGVESPLQNKEILDKVRSTCKTRYGHEFPMRSEGVKEKARRTTLERYGVSSTSKLEEVKHKIHETKVKKYGPNYEAEGISKIKKFIETTYGVSNIFQAEEFKEVIKNNARANRIASGNITLLPNNLTVAEYARRYARNPAHAYLIYNSFGYEILKEWLENNKSPFSEKSSLEREFESKTGILFFNKKILDGVNYRPDFKINDSIYVDVDGLVVHSEVFCKDNRRHFNKRRYFESSGLRLFQFREDEVKTKMPVIQSILNSHLGLTKRVYARSCSFKEIKYQTYKTFVEANHLQGAGPNCKAYGLFFKEELVQVLGIRYTNKTKQVAEITRFCSKLDLSIVGGFSKLLKNTIKSNSFKKIRTFADLRYSYGKVYVNCGFSPIRDTLGWRWTDGVSTFNRLTCKADKTTNISEKEEALGRNLVKIYDAGQRLFELSLE